MGFKSRVNDYIEKAIEGEGDEYTEIFYNDNICLHVCSHFDGEGYFELEVMIPHKNNPKIKQNPYSFELVDGFDKFIEDLEDVLTDKVDNVNEATNFQHTETFDEGDSSYPAHNVYSTLKIEEGS